MPLDHASRVLLATFIGVAGAGATYVALYAWDAYRQRQHRMAKRLEEP